MLEVIVRISENSKTLFPYFLVIWKEDSLIIISTVIYVLLECHKTAWICDTNVNDYSYLIT